MRFLVVSHPCVVPANQELFARLEAQTGWHVTIVVPSRMKLTYGWVEAGRWEGFGGTLIPIPVIGRRSIQFHAYARRLSRIFVREAPDAIFVHHEPYSIATFQSFLGARAVPRAPIGFYSIQNMAKSYPPPFSWYERYVYRRADFALAGTDAVADVLKQKGYGGPIDILPFGVGRYAGDEPPTRNATGELVVGYVGRLAKEKGIDTILEALATPSGRDKRALIVGDGPERAALEQQTADLGLSDRVTWEGYVPHDRMAGVYGKMDLLAVPSRTVTGWKEQFGRVVIEALACGVPVVTSDSGELPELVARTGGGWVVPEGDATALASLLARVDAERAELRNRAVTGRDSVRSLFDLDLVAERFAAVLQAQTESRGG
jgi:glycosyltransferase involved in cell wall biosynthesis